MTRGFAITVGVYALGGISGDHQNPVVSVVLVVFRGFSWKLCVQYILGQMLGSFVAGMIAIAVYGDAINHFDPTRSAAGISASALFTAPPEYVTPQTAFLSEFVTTALLICVILALGDDNLPPPGNLNPLIIGILVATLTFSMGLNSGPCLNPARDLGPRLAALSLGYDVGIWTDLWWLYGVVGATFSGGLTGAFVYDLLVFRGGESPVNYRWSSPKQWWRERRLFEKDDAKAAENGQSKVSEKPQ